MKMPEKKKPYKKYTSLSAHRKDGTVLKPPLGSYPNLVEIDWQRDLLPEHIMIALFAEHFSLASFTPSLYSLLKAIDEFIPEDCQAIGFISDFALVPKQGRDEFHSKHRDIVENLVYPVLGQFASLFPESPIAWLKREDLSSRDGHFDRVAEINKLRRIVVKLLPAKDEYCGLIRSIPIARMLFHEKLPQTHEIEIFHAMRKYPFEASKQEKFLVESFARTTVNMYYIHEKIYSDRKWPKYFWRQNFNLAECLPKPNLLYGSKPINEAGISEIMTALSRNVATIVKYPKKLQKVAKLDLYVSSKDEIFFGLIARIIRLYVLLASDPNLWSRDIGGIIVRCLADTAITFSYLARKGDDELFRKFIEFGKGQEKLLMLHLQDNYPGAESFDGRDAASISEELGGFSIEMINIELGHWIK